MESDNRSLEPIEPNPADDERLFHELNLLRLEGYYFCLDPKASAKYTRKREFVERIRTPNEVLEQPLAIEPNPNYGYPSIIAYKVLQACMKKLSEYGLPVPDSVCFTQRELARMIGRKSFGGKDSQAIFQAAMQLYKTDIWSSFYDKETQEWQAITFRIIDECLFSGKKDRISRCVFKINSRIVKSLNHRYAFWINHLRLDGLEPIATALYKHLFYHFGTLFSQLKRPEFTFHKDYADICTQWLGGLTVLKYKSKILNEQLGRHLQLLKKRELINKFELGKNSDGDGFTLVFWPGPGFFADYQRFYGGQLQLQFAKAADEKNLHHPMQAVRYFYAKLYQTDDVSDLIFSEKEVDLAAKFLEQHSFEDVCGFIDYSLNEAKKTAYDVKTFLGIKQYQPGFTAHRKALLKAQEQEQRRRQEAQERQLEEQYRAFRKQKTAEARQALPAAELDAIERTAREQIEAEHASPIGRDILVRVRIEQMIAERTALPSFEAWKESAR
jgi:hypothetical protein